MSELITFWVNNALGVLIVFFRIFGLFLLLPVFSHRVMSGIIKIIFSLALSFAIYPIVEEHIIIPSNSFLMLFILVIKESLIGFLMGFVVYVTFEAISLAAQFVGYQMGFGVVSLIDPQNQSQVSIMVPLHWWMAALIFILSDIHHEVISILVGSYSYDFSIVSFSGQPFINFITNLTSKLFTLTIQIGAPVGIIMLLSNFGIGVLGRLMPQMNILLFSFPITILLGIFAMYLISPDLIAFMETNLEEVSNEIMELFRTI